MKKIALIVARDIYGTIGNNGSLPNWRLKDDMAFFKFMTKGNPVIMGRKNWESIPEKFRPLPDRTNIVLTRNKNWSPENDYISTVHNLWGALDIAEQSHGTTTFIIGGAEIYSLAIEKVTIDIAYITDVQGTFEGDIKFPKLPLDQFEFREERLFKADEKNSHSFSIRTYYRKTA